MLLLAPRTFRSRRWLVILGAGLSLLLPLTLSAFQRGTPAGSPGPTPQPSPPVVEFQAVPDREKAEPGEEIQVALFISNKSAKTLTKLRLNFPESNFELVKNAALPESLPAFRSVNEKVTIKPNANSGFGSRKLLLSMEYAWNGDGAEFVSAQPATATVLVARRFDEETKGFPGGTAAFFYLLLPIIPAILSYQFFEGLRKGEGAKLPSFKPEYIVPAFLAAVVLSLLMLVAFRLDAGLNYSNPLVFMIVLLGSFIAGAVVPVGFWIRDYRRKRRWAFTKGDSLESYLKKALLSPWSPPQYEWAQGTVDADEWEGVPLRQPSGATVLGAVLQVSYRQKPSEDQWKSLINEVVDQKGVLINPQRLLEMVQSKQLQLGFNNRIKQDEQPIDRVVVIDEVKNWKRADGEASPLIRPFR